MECLVQDLGLSAFVRFHGHVPHTEVPNALRSFDLFCAPSIQESFSVAVVEAMACGIPCVTSDADGFTEVMENGATGFVVPKKDINALAEKIVLLVRDGALRSKMGKAGRERALRLYDWEQNIRTIADELVEAMQTNLPQS